MPARTMKRIAPAASRNPGATAQPLINPEALRLDDGVQIATTSSIAKMLPPGFIKKEAAVTGSLYD